MTSRARLGFHAAWDPGYKGRKIINSEATQSLYSMYPFEVRHWIDQRGGLTPRMIFLSGRELAAMYRPCYLDLTCFFALNNALILCAAGDQLS